MRIIRRISALIIGIVFFISGLLKLMDPVGTGLIVESYLAFFKLGFLASATSVLAYLIALCETICGTALLTGVARKLTAIFALVMLSGFTVVTVVLFIENPEMDCGCFGEAIHLTHAQSLLKNIVLLLFWLLAFIPLSRQERTRKIKFASFALVVVSVLLFGLYTSLSIPPVEFTNYKPGTELFLPEEVGIDEQKTAATLSLAGADGQYYDSLAVTGKVMVVSSYKPSAVSRKRWEKIADFVETAGKAGYLPVVALASAPYEMEQMAVPSELMSYVYFADRKDLVTLNRSNGGVSYIADGQIVSKWSVHALPKQDELSAIFSQNPTEVLVEENNAPRLRLQAFLLYVFAIMLLL